MHNHLSKRPGTKIYFTVYRRKRREKAGKIPAKSVDMVYCITFESVWGVLHVLQSVRGALHMVFEHVGGIARVFRARCMTGIRCLTH